MTFARRVSALRITPKTADTVVVFSPPPVPDGDAPTTISMTTRNREAWDS
jgi:hypothetical protein